uniref:Serine/threonine-protein kinase receptor n=1 Tax=Halisarca dujardinii TaxID=2583056 RepID=A0A8F8FL34_HALDU|nr:TGF-beta receptor type I HduTGFbRIb [Halisarca dujardinii]
MLEQKTISRQVKLNVQIGRGRYGEVWVGKWFDKEVAVKKFAFCDKESWTREREIYETDMLRNEYILTYLAADMYEREFSSCLEMWMVTDFHEHGSLFDYLNQYSLSEYHMIKFARTTASGLAFLHMDLRTRDSVKPCIAHRDIKSRNILVKSDLACCIADFGLAVRHDTVKNLIDIAPNSKQGTKRYMSPEVLGETINIDDFTSFKNSDIYSLGLVLWEILRRCLVDGECLEYQLPYHERVPGDPSIAEMKTLVVDEKYRPEIKKRWVDSSEACSAMASIIEECWSPLPEARLNARRVEKNFSDVDVKRPPYS